MGAPRPRCGAVPISSRAAAAPTWPKAWAGIRLPLYPLPHCQPRGGAVRAQRRAPLRPRAAKSSAFRSCTPHPRNFTPLPRHRAALPACGHPVDRVEDPRGRGQVAPAPVPGPAGPCAPKGGARRWADKRGDRQGPAYHGAAALGAHRAPQDRAAPGGRARARAAP